MQCWCEDITEKRVNKLREAIRIKREMKKENPGSYCCIIKVPFRKRHPNFPLWFSLASLLLVIFSPVVEWCIHHIHQIMQLWI